MPVTFFDTEINDQKIPGSSCGEPDETRHDVALFEGECQMIIRVRLQGQQPVDLLFPNEMAVEFTQAAIECLFRIGLSDRVSVPARKQT